jgi:signal transduction histidine kinase
VLVGAAPEASGSVQVHSLARRDYLLGRSSECDLVVGARSPGVSRRHARLHWKDGSFSIEDAGSTHATFVNGRRLSEKASEPLGDGDVVTLGDVALRFLGLHLGRGCAAPIDPMLNLMREMFSLEPATVVQRALELLRQVSGVERSFLVDAGVDPRLEPLLTPLDDPELRISRSSIEAALGSGEKVKRFFEPDETAPRGSIAALALRRIWVSPVIAGADRAVAAVYLDSADPASPLDEDTERLMDCVVEQIGVALRNARLHGEVVGKSRGLERTVAQRTRELQDSREMLISQDRLATLGRLVAGIAHELNNPVGAIASFARTVGGLLDSIVRLGDALRDLLPEAGDRQAARRLLDATLDAAARPPADTRSRRERTRRFAALLADRGVPGGEELARRLGRIGLEPADIEPSLGPLHRQGASLVSLLDRAYTFGRGLATIESAAGNVARIVDGLKTYAHLDQARVEEADLHGGIQAALEVLRSRIPEGIRIETRFDEIRPFPHRPGELTQVWTNLIDNAVSAMGEEGTLLVTTRDRGERVEVRVQDSGPGIPEDIQTRIFELHTTTRGPGAGLGLGLPICRAIVEKNHGGRIAVASEPGRTVFTVVLPKSPPEAEEDQT